MHFAWDVYCSAPVLSKLATKSPLNIGIFRKKVSLGMFDFTNCYYNFNLYLTIYTTKIEPRRFNLTYEAKDGKKE